MAIDTTPALELVKISSGYDRSEILQNVSLTVRTSSVLALLGRNGAGKTTCISTIAGMIRPTRGEIRLFRKPIATLAIEDVIRAGVALVPQGRRIFSTLSVRENLAVVQPARPPYRGPEWSIEKIVEIFPRLAERIGQRAETLSGGEQQMLAIARALMAHPRVLLLDEPSEGLSPQMIAEVARTVGRLRDEGLSILLVEQNSRLAMSVANDVALLSNGRIAFAGTAAQFAENTELMELHLGVRAAATPR